jgi:hypothetical protein
MANKKVNTVVEQAMVDGPKFKIPEEYKKVLYRDWPDALKKEYQAYRKARYEKAAAEKEELWSKLLSMLDGEALDLALQIKNDLKKRASALSAIFGTTDVLVGDSVPFNMDLLGKVKTVNDKGNVTLEITDNKIVVAAINTTE